MHTMILLALGLLVTPMVSHAQWARGESGEWEYTFNYATSITFGCGPDWSGCTASSNILTFQSSTGSLTFTFTGTSGVFTARRRGDQFDFGTLHVTETGSYSFPTIGHPATLFLTFELAVNSTVPAPVSPVWRGGYVRDLGIVDGSYITAAGSSYGFSNWFPFPTSPLAPASTMVVEHGMPPRIDASSGDFLLTARVGLVPEPSTWMMLGTGLLGLGGVALRTRRRRD